MMRWIYIMMLSGCFFHNAEAQYDINSWHYGLAITKGLGSARELGAGVRIEYAMNCSTTFLGEYNRSFFLDSNPEDSEYNELALGVNIILFNWYPTTITAGIGYIGNDSAIFESIEKDAYLSFRTGDFNHGAQIKFRMIHRIGSSLNIFAELNIKSLGRHYDTLGIGFNYDFFGRKFKI